MARITPIDVIQGISGKYGNGSSDYFATNSSSNRIRLAKYKNKPTGEPTQDQKDQMEKFGTQAKLASAWLRANHPSEENGELGTEAYQEAQALKRQMHLSNVRQVVIKYMAEDGTVTLPSGSSGSSGSNGSSGTTQYTLSLSASPTNGGTVSGGGNYTVGSTPQISAVAASGYQFSKWSDDNTNATRTVTMNSNKNLQAIFTVVSGGGGENEGGM